MRNGRQNLNLKPLRCRWLWKGGQTKIGGLVPWSHQMLNTAPSCFLWEADGTAIVTMVGGEKSSAAMC